MKTKAVPIIFMIVFMLMLLTPLVCMDFQGGDVSEQENRMLAKRPGIEELKGDPVGFMNRLGSWFSDNVGFRESLIAFHNLYNRIGNPLAHPTYYTGKEGHLFFQMPGADVVNKDMVDEEYLTVFADFVKKAENYCEQRGSEFLFAINPMKTAVYPEYLPDSVIFKDIRMNRLDELLRERMVKHISVKDILQENKSRFLVMNKIYDVNHWNDNGAFVAFSAILNELRENFPLIQPLQEDWYEKETVQFTILPQSDIRIDDSAERYNLKNPNAQRAFVYDDYIWSDPRFAELPYYAHYINESNPHAPRILVFAGSYYFGRERFVTESFSACMFVRNYWNICNLDYYYNIFKPDIVIFVAAQHALYDHYFPTYQMDNTAFPPVYDVNELADYEKGLFSVGNRDWAVICDYISSSDAPFIELGWDIIDGPVTHAYALVGADVYDMKINAVSGTGQQQISCTFIKDDLLAGKFSLLLVDAESGKYNIVEFNGGAPSG